MVDLLAVVVSYGETAQLNCLIQDLTLMPECRVMLVENKVGARHEALPEAVSVLGGHGNVGYGTAINLAVAEARRAGPTPGWLLVVNSDIALPTDTRDAIQPLLRQASGDAEAVGFAVRTSGGERGRSSAVLPSVRTNAFTAVRGENAAVERWPHQRYPIGAFFAIRTETFVRLGGFDPVYWMYYRRPTCSRGCGPLAVGSPGRTTRCRSSTRAAARRGVPACCRSSWGVRRRSTLVRTAGPSARAGRSSTPRSSPRSRPARR